jgi:hypothetical protein
MVRPAVSTAGILRGENSDRKKDSDPAGSFQPVPGAGIERERNNDCRKTEKNGPVLAGNCSIPDHKEKKDDTGCAQNCRRVKAYKGNNAGQDKVVHGDRWVLALYEPVGAYTAIIIQDTLQEALNRAG